MTDFEQSLDKAHLEAAYWIDVFNDATDIDPQIPEFRKWLETASENRPAFWDLRDACDDLDLLKEDGASDLKELCEEVRTPAPARNKHTWRWAACIAALVLMATALIRYAPTYFQDRCTTPSTQQPGACKLSQGLHNSGAAETPELELVDGTDITLQANSEVALDLGTHRRVVYLTRGEALFKVSSNPEVPFEVVVGAFRVRDVGTVFSIRRTGADSAQTVAREGQIEVFGPNGQYRLVKAGEVVEFDGTLISVHPVAMPTVMFELSPAGKPMLIFEGAPLTEAVRVFNWYNRRELLVDADLAQLNIGGQFSATNPAGFVDALETTLGITHSVSRDPGTGKEIIRLRKRRPPNDPSRTTQYPHVLKGRN